MLVTRRSMIAGGAALTGLAAAARSQSLVPTSAQDMGPFYPVIHPADHDADLTSRRGAKGVARGDPINVIGRILDLHGNPIRSARIELWQANALGRYDHPLDAQNKAALDPNFQGYALLTTDRDGRFKFRTIKPAAYTIPSGATRPPHIHFDIRGRSQRVITQMYFPGEPLNDSDFVFKTADPKESVIARSIERLSGDPRAAVFAWDVVLAAG